MLTYATLKGFSGVFVIVSTLREKNSSPERLRNLHSWETAELGFPSGSLTPEPTFLATLLVSGSRIRLEK